MKGVSMPDPVTHGGIVAIILAAISTVIGFTFDVGPATIFAALGGSIFGICISRPISPWLWGPLLVIGGTCAAGWLLPDVIRFMLSMKYLPELSEKTLAFLFALGLVGGRSHIIPTIQAVFEAVLNAAITRIQSWGTKSKRQEGQ
jgi:hypothetical protein